ncbi:MAG: hypothetical protein JWO89_2101 [Verrucomicrobiaceae bacterium]|nr:hypothetical protein [Verrucomicrobiaceae bacterium]
MMLTATLIARSATAAETPFSLGSKERVAEIRATCSEDRWLSAELDSKFESFGEFLPIEVGWQRDFLLYQSEIVAEEVTFHTEKGEDLTQRPIVRSTVPWATAWTKTDSDAPVPAGQNGDLQREIPRHTATREGWVARLYQSGTDGRLLVIKLGIPGLTLDDSPNKFVKKRVQKRREFNNKEQVKAEQGNAERQQAEQEKAAKAEALARLPPFSLGSAERVAEIRKTFTKDRLPAELAALLDTQKAGFECYREKPRPGKVIARTVLLYRSEIVQEDIFFKAAGEAPLIERDTVRDTLPWATAWAESTLKTASPKHPDYADTPYDVIEVPLYTATRAGWVAKLYPGGHQARLVVQKLGIPGLHIGDFVPSAEQRALLKRLEVKDALYARPPTKLLPFSLGTPERVAHIRKTFAPDSPPLLADESELPFHDELKFYKEKDPLGVLRFSVVLDEAETVPDPAHPPDPFAKEGATQDTATIVAEDIVFKAPDRGPITHCDTVRTTVPWASTWVESTLAQASFSEAAQAYVLLDVPLYSATCAGGMARLYSVKGTARLVVQKRGIPGLNIDEWLASVAPHSPPKNPQAAPAKPQPEKIVKARPRPPADTAFSLGDQERVAEIREKGGASKPLPPLDKPGSGFDFYPSTFDFVLGRPAEYLFSLQSSLLYRSGNRTEIVAEEFFFLTPGPEPVTEHETVRTTVPWASAWTESAAPLPAAGAAIDPDSTGQVYTATCPGWVAKLFPFKGAARLAVIKLGIPGLKVEDWSTSYSERVLQRDKAEEEKEQKERLKSIEPKKNKPDKTKQERERKSSDRGK